MPKLRSLIVLLFMLATQQAGAGLLIDTGPSTGPDLLPVSGQFGANRNFAAAQVNFEYPVRVETVAIHILVQGQFQPENTMTLSITNDDGGNVPGDDVLASVTMMIDNIFFINWAYFEGIDLDLEQGRYWITLTVNNTSNFIGALGIGTPAPLDNYAVFTENTAQWSPLPDSPGFSIRVEGEPLLDESDGDGIDDANDNCIDIANPMQRDTDGDGYGNHCDPDLNNDGTVNFLDIALWTPFFGSATSGDADLNGDGFANFLDYITFSSLFLFPPGPSGLVP